MGKQKRRRMDRPDISARGRWRTVGILATMVVGVGIVVALNLAKPGRRVPDGEVGPHDHPPGPHGGAVVAIDKANRYHAEAVFGADGRVRLYTFGRELAAAHPVAARTLCAAVRGHDGAEEHAVMLRPEPQDADPPGTASRFVGRFPLSVWREHVQLVVWSLPVGRDRFRFHIDSQSPPPDAGAVERAAAAEAALYSHPGGKYRAEDIEANGAAPASRKYRGERPAHNDRPGAGERVCPVSRSSADPRFVWVVGGREYRFCCPPCLDEFVTAAKERPGEVREPDFYKHK
jgi:hypothetical protein